MGVSIHLVKLIEYLYNNNTAVVRVGEYISKQFQTARGVRQGSILAPVLFNKYGESMMRRALEDWEGGRSVG